MVLVNAGDFSLAPDPHGALKSEVLRDAMIAMGYDVIVPGERELSMGPGFLDPLSREIPLLSCNLLYEGESFGRPYVVLDRGGLKIGLVGVTQVAGRGRIPAGWEVREPEEAIGEITGDLRKKVDLLVGLFHVGLQPGKQLAARFQEFDVVILAHGGGKFHEPFIMGKTIVLKGETKGRSLGRLDLEITSSGSVSQTSAKLIPLGSEVEDHPAMQKFLDDYSEKRKGLIQKSKVEKRTDTDPTPNSLRR